MTTKSAPLDEDLSVIGIDIGKDVFHLVGFELRQASGVAQEIRRLALVTTFQQFPRCVIGMDACLSARFVSQTLREPGFEPRIIPAIYVKPFNRGQKNEDKDTEAIANAALRSSLKTVS